MNSSAYVANMKDVTEKDKNTLKSHAAIQETRVRCQKKKKCNRCVRTGLVESGRGLPVYREEEEEENEGKKRKIIGHSSGIFAVEPTKREFITFLSRKW